MKKVLTALVMLATVIGVFALRTSAAGTGNLVVHVQKWDGDYSLVGLNSWGDTAMPGLKKPSESGAKTDDFGIYFEFNDVTVASEGTIGFQAVIFDDGQSPNWSKKIVNMEIPKSQIVEGKTRHVYAFEGGISRENDIPQDKYAFPIYAPVDKESVIIVYYDATGNYEENLGFHSWGWETNADGWNMPLKNFTPVGRTTDGTAVLGALHVKSGADFGGLIVYYGAGDDSKKTGNIEIGNSSNAAYIATPKAASESNVVYVNNKGDANVSMNNVYLSPTVFAEEAFAFRLVGFNSEEMSGTFASSPTTVIVSTNQEILNPYAKALTTAEKAAADATVKSWFTIKEKTGVATYGPALQIERVDYAKSNSTLKDFVVILKNGSALDIAKEYEVFFSTHPATLAEDKQVEVTINLTVTEDTPVDAVLSVAGSFQGWNVGTDGYKATKINATTYELVFNVNVKEGYSIFEYKWTRGNWDTAENIASNRKLVIPNTVSEIVFEDEILAWADAVGAESYPAPERTAPSKVAASLLIDMDKEAPVFTFISPSGIVGKPAAERIIEVEWGKPFDQNLFPGYRVIDDRDGDLTPLVFVPKGEFSKIDTSKVGDYTIMLQVEDKWGNITQETFIFRVVKK